MAAAKNFASIFQSLAIHRQAHHLLAARTIHGQARHLPAACDMHHHARHPPAARAMLRPILHPFAALTIMRPAFHHLPTRAILLPTLPPLAARAIATFPDPHNIICTAICPPTTHTILRTVLHPHAVHAHPSICPSLSSPYYPTLGMFFVVLGITGAFLYDGQNIIVQLKSIVYSETKDDGEEIAEAEQTPEEMTKHDKDKATNKEKAKFKALFDKEIKRWENERNSRGKDGNSSEDKEGKGLFARVLERLENIFGFPGRLMRLKTSMEEGYVLAIAVYTYLPTILILNRTDIITKLREKHQEMVEKASCLVSGDVARKPSSSSSSIGQLSTAPSSIGLVVQPPLSASSRVAVDVEEVGEKTDEHCG